MGKVKWNPDRCSHAGICVATLPEVFRIEDGQFLIDETAATTDEIQEVVNRCPSGALSYEDQ